MPKRALISLSRTAQMDHNYLVKNCPKRAPITLSRTAPKAPAAARMSSRAEPFIVAKLAFLIRFFFKLMKNQKLYQKIHCFVSH